MSTLIRNIVAVIVGVVLGSVVNMAIVVVGLMVIPLPDGVDLSNPETFAENLKLIKPVNFIAPWLAHALGTLVGAFLAAKIAASYKLVLAMVIGSLFLLGGISMVVMMQGPVVFAVMDLIFAYLPMAYAGAILAGAKKKPTEPTAIA